MKLLLDTHVLLWAAIGQLPKKARGLIEDTANRLFFSPASLWEIAIKRALKRDDFQVDAALLYAGLLESGYEELPMTGRHVLFIDTLPPIHKDPFDRVLIAQALAEEMTFVTADGKLTAYPGAFIKVTP
jgi:PIN domain nuclease of toxin-antitoxin system